MQYPAGPQPRPSTPSVPQPQPPCQTSTTTIHAQRSLPNLNHDHPRPVFPAEHEKVEKGTGKTKSDGPEDEKVCRFFGARMMAVGKDRSASSNMTGRCFGCSATGHSKKDCPASRPKVMQTQKQAVKVLKEKNTWASKTQPPAKPSLP